MRNTFKATHLTGSIANGTKPILRRSLDDLLAPLDSIARKSASLIVNRDSRFECDGECYTLTSYLFIGPKGGDAPIRIGIFAGIHGDEPESAYAAARFIQALEANPELATGYCISIFPICNPTGFEDNTRHSRRGKDLNREFWKQTSEPEVWLLEAELAASRFDGIISLHIDDTSHGFYGIVGGSVLTRHLIEPALKAAESLLPLDTRARIDGFKARGSVIRECYQGILSAPQSSRPRPFEIVLEAPKGQPAFLTESAFVVALQSILDNYRGLAAWARNI
jgi:hypothetical protein